MVKLVVSYHPEYEPILLSDSIRDKIRKEAIAPIPHTEFENNSGSAVRESLNHYNIPFTLFEYFCAEMSNPPFLTLYCKIYNGEDVSLPGLYERLVRIRLDLLLVSLAFPGEIGVQKVKTFGFVMM